MTLNRLVMTFLREIWATEAWFWFFFAKWSARSPTYRPRYFVIDFLASLSAKIFHWARRYFTEKFFHQLLTFMTKLWFWITNLSPKIFRGEIFSPTLIFFGQKSADFAFWKSKVAENFSEENFQRHKLVIQVSSWGNFPSFCDPKS